MKSFQALQNASELSAGQRAWAKSTAKSPNWKVRFKEQCIGRLQDMRIQAHQNHRQSLSPQKPPASNENYEMAYQLPNPTSRVLFPSQSSASSSNTHESNNDSTYEDTLLEKFIRQELSTFIDVDEPTDENIDYLLSLEEQQELHSALNEALYQDLHEEEQRMTIEYFANEYDKESLEYQRQGVPCPVCKQHELMKNDRVIFCPCGIRIDTQSDNMDLEYVKHSISETVANHTTRCHGTPFFYVEEQWMVSLLFLGCGTCGTRDVAL